MAQTLRPFENAARLAAVFAPAAPAPTGQGILFGDLGGVHPALDKYGISLGPQSTNEVLGNPNGGRRRGATFDGQNALGLGVNLEKAVGLKGGLFNVSALQT